MSPLRLEQVIPYSTLEYVRGTRSYDNQSNAGGDSSREADGLDIYLAKTFNRMDARRYRTDAVVMIPSDARGDASLASLVGNGAFPLPAGHSLPVHSLPVHAFVGRCPGLLAISRRMEGLAYSSLAYMPCRALPWPTLRGCA